MQRPLRIGVLLSGSGRTLQNFIDLRAVGKLPIEIPIVIGSRANLYGLERAANAKIPTEVIDRKTVASLNDFSDRIFNRCDQAKVDLICCAGWLCLLNLPDRYLGRAMNIHPA